METQGYRVDIAGGERVVQAIQDDVESTHGPTVLKDYGGFGGLMDISGLEERNPVLCASTDSVGSKITLAQQMGHLDGIGEDLVNHCVNDILVQSPTMRPLFFLDYVASDKLREDEAAQLVRSVCEASRENGMAVLGGETAEIHSIYKPGCTDIAGTIVGVTCRDDLLRPKETITEGDVVLAFPSNGLMTNGFTYVLDNLMESLLLIDRRDILAVHPSYLESVRSLDKESIKGMVHVTGGGLAGNAHRVMPPGLLVNWDVKQIQSMMDQVPTFRWLFENCSMSMAEKIKTFNCGAGFLVITAKDSKLAEEAARYGLTKIGHATA